MVSLEGIALGFYRDNYFINWDIDIELFASINDRESIPNFLSSSGFIEKNFFYFIEYLGDDRGILILTNSDSVPLGIKFYDPSKDFFEDISKGYSWN